jgi:hypothetical protein
MFCIDISWMGVRFAWEQKKLEARKIMTRSISIINYALYWALLVRCFSKITMAIPPRIAMEANTKRMLMGSPRKTIPPKAAITGTLLIFEI